MSSKGKGGGKSPKKPSSSAGKKSPAAASSSPSPKKKRTPSVPREELPQHAQEKEHDSCDGPLAIKGEIQPHGHEAGVSGSAYRGYSEHKGSKPSSRPAQAKVLESGLVCFLYRPKVGVTEAKSMDDVQKMYMLLSPSSCPTEPRKDNDAMPKRLLILPTKKLPFVSERRHDRAWAFVDVVSKENNEIEEVVGTQVYSTKTRGERTLGACRIVGQGLYEIVENAGKTSFAYVLEVPAVPTEVQESFNIDKEAAYIVNVKNPNRTPSGGGFGRVPNLKEKPAYPKELQEKFEGVRVEERQWVALNPPDFLNYRNTELLLIGQGDDLEQELGEVGISLQEAEAFEEDHIKGKPADQVYKDFPALSKEEHSAEPTKGKFT